MYFSESAGASDSATLEYQRGRLAAAMPLSVHTAKRGALFGMAAKRVCCAVVVFLFCIPFLAVAVNMLQKDEFGPAAVNAAIAGLFFVLALWLVSSGISRYTDAVTSIEVCHDGLRITQGQEHYQTLWAEFADVTVAHAAPPSGQAGLAGAAAAWGTAAAPKIAKVTIKLNTGKTLVLYPNALSDFVSLTRTLVERVVEMLNSQHINGGIPNAGRGFAQRPR